MNYKGSEEQEIKIVKTDSDRVEQIMNGEVRNVLAERSLARLRSDPFSKEFENPNHFLVEPNISYYFVFHYGHYEALIRSRQTRGFSDIRSGVSEIKSEMSFGRIVDRQQSPILSGWQYVEAFIEREMFPLGVNHIAAKVVSKGGYQALNDLERIIQVRSKPYFLHWIGRTAHITNDLRLKSLLSSCVGGT